MNEASPDRNPRDIVNLGEYRNRRPEHLTRDRSELSAELGERVLRVDQLKTRPRQELTAFMDHIYREGDIHTIMELSKVRGELEAQQLSDAEVLTGVLASPLASDEWRQIRQQTQEYFKEGKLELAEELTQLESQLRREGVAEDHIVYRLNDRIAAHYEAAEGGEVDVENDSSRVPEDVTAPKRPSLRIVK